MDPESSQLAPKGSSDGEASAPAELTINLKIISPSLTLPVSLLGLPATTTVLQVKERVRQKLQSRPSDAQQRLIYRGRMLNRPEEKLLDLFGEEMIRTSDQQTIHLILPEQVESPSLSSTTTPVRGQSPARQEAINNAHHQYFDSVLQQGARHLSRRTVTTTTTTVSSPAGTHNPTDPQNHPANTHPTAPRCTGRNTARPIQHKASSRWLNASVEKQRAKGLICTNMTAQEWGWPDFDITIFRRHPASTPLTTVLIAARVHHPMQREIGLALQNRASFSGLHANPTIQAGTEVYILNSPNGPRGLLLNNHTETYYTPSMRPTATSSGSSYGLPNPQQLRQHFAFMPTTPTPTLPPQLGVNQDNQGDVDGQGRVLLMVTTTSGGPQQDAGAPNRGNPNPENMAVRLVGQRRAANADWLLDRVRRAERAGLLFLASIAPGVAERHIANLEAEIERQRRETEAAEAARRAAEAEAEAAAGTETADGAVGEENTTGEEGSPAIAGSAPQVNVDEPSPPPEADRQPDLIQV
ncbi:unnamed protein product [Parascedosporium putredinis]|uniref:Ubiquitin-like domain-containing protein n=1 Tax=Parascedosporium putredinis TaxID=1442378 RepID=A0A9P1GXJ7_9PEZI|nr:unnamed protein product [Parascedosporium putredinis]CAI7989913.1 unnamed protein product [Parascedosporium putredinis]